MSSPVINKSNNTMSPQPSWANVAKSPKPIALIEATVLPSVSNSVISNAEVSAVLGEFGVAKVKKIKKKSNKTGSNIESMPPIVDSMQDTGVVLTPDAVVDLTQVPIVDSMQDAGVVSTPDAVVDSTQVPIVDSIQVPIIDSMPNTAVVLTSNAVVDSTQVLIIDSMPNAAVVLTPDALAVVSNIKKAKMCKVVYKFDSKLSEDIIIEGDTTNSERLFALKSCESARNNELNKYAHSKAEEVRKAVCESLRSLGIDENSIVSISNDNYQAVYSKYFNEKDSLLKMSNLMNNNNLSLDIGSIAVDVSGIPLSIESSKVSYLDASKQTSPDKVISAKSDASIKTILTIKNKFKSDKDVLTRKGVQTPEESLVQSNLKKSELLSAAKQLVEDLIDFTKITAACESHNNDWKGCIFTIDVNCHNRKLGVTNCGMPIFPRNFLDNTFLVGTKYFTNAHQTFRKEFVDRLEEEISGLHVRFEKSIEDPLVFAIKFYNKRESY